MCIKPLFRVTPDGRQVFVPCGECLLCREKKSMELMFYSSCEQRSQYRRGRSCTFVTLTYSDDNLLCSWIAGDSDVRVDKLSDIPLHHLFKPPVPTLSRSEFQGFNKRFRYYVHKFYGKDYDYKFLASGEYGDQASRPHFHFIAYGLNPTQVERCVYPAWNRRGQIEVEPLGVAGTNYLVGYVAALPTRSACKVMFDDANRERPFLIHSQHLGSEVLDEFVSEYLESDSHPDWTGVEQPLPSYIRRKYNGYFDKRKWYKAFRDKLEFMHMTEEAYKDMRYNLALNRVRGQGIASYDESYHDYLSNGDSASRCDVHKLSDLALGYSDDIPF